MRNLLFAIIVMWGTAVTVPTFACSGACSSDSDCSSNACKTCDTDFGVCADCCEYTEAINCPAACSWNGSECRNDSSTACGVIVPETPKNYRYLFFALLLAGVTTFFFFMRRKLVLPRK